MNLLVTGGAGYIGSHFILEALRDNHQIIALDNFSTSSKSTIEKLREISKKNFDFYEVGIDDQINLDKIFKRHRVDIVVHFAGLKSVPESIEKPDLYMRNNVQGSKILLNEMIKYKVNKIIFSSSASVYGDNNSPLKEELNPKPLNPYAESKVRVENTLIEMSKEFTEFKAVILRYFNPVGCDPSYQIGEIQSKPSNLFPIICSSIAANSFFEIFGNDFDTHDGTPIRDFIHISDLIRGHLGAIDWLDSSEQNLIKINLGTGKGHSVLDIVKKFQEVVGRKIKYKFSSRRKGDPGTSYADCNLAYEELNWKALKNLDQMCYDSMKWHKILSQKKT